MKVTVYLTYLELSNLRIGERHISGKTPVSFETDDTGLPNVPKKATAVQIIGGLTIATVPEIRYHEINEINDTFDAIQQVQDYLDEKDHSKAQEASDMLESAKELINDYVRISNETY